ncbi:hypothetical protein P3X46_028258 [Hevea brasiliensis]|uniref:Disease resistance protein At4g27190-like leucine-rich repeats domain-containing protein n=1 Tax=Hevea brasiliensis TaxID=3981 RepID=A0ABQ9KND7_HEVBR|nr:hypothetical protein P3X46_028258 [Hevea brasiliensis]
MEILIAVASAIAVEIPKALVAPISRHIGYLTGYELNIKNLKEELEKLKDKKTVVDRHVAGPTADSIIQWQEEVDDIIVSQTPNIKKIQGDIASWLKLKLDDENELKRAGMLRQGLINHGCTNEIVADSNYAKVLQLRDDASDIKETGMKVLMGKAEVLNLIEVTNLEVISTDECVEQGYLVDALQGIPRLPEIQLPYFGKLRELNIQSCDVLKYFIPLSMAKGLRQLHKISVEICKEMEGIFNNSEVDDEVEFPELTDLKLRDLPNFRGFIINKSLSWKDIDQPSTSQRNNSTEIEHAQLQSMAGPVEMISILFPSLCQRLSNLQKLELIECGLLKVVFPPSVAQHLVRLKELTIIYCREIEYIVAETQEEEKDTRISKIVFPNLILLELSWLPKLMAFCADNHISFDWPSLECFTLYHCPKMEKLCSAIPDSSTLKNSFDQSGLSGKKVMYPTRLVRRGRKQKDVSNKEDIEQQNTSRMNNKTEIEHAQLQFTTGPVEIISILFPSLWLPSNLQELSLDSCGFVKVVFPVSVTQQLEQLKYLTIWDCPKVEYIVAEAQEGKNKRISQKMFPNLIRLILFRLPKLMALCADSHISFDCLSLKEFTLVDCPKMKILCSTISDPSALKKSFDQSDLSGKKVMCPISSIIGGLVRRGEQKNVSNKEVSLIKNQEDPSVSHIDEKTRKCYAFPSKLIERLQNLKNLKIFDCDSMEVIFSFEGLIPKECHATAAVLNSMEQMRFRRLSNLKHVCFKIPPEIKAFQKLRKLEVESCDNLINLFSPGLAKLLVKLQKIKITSCKMMEEIIGKEDEEKQEESMQKIVFPQLSSLTFGNLPNFKGFYSGIYALELPKIQKLKIFDEKCTVNELLLTRLLIRRKNTLRRIEDGQPSDGDLSNVRVLDVENCQDSVNLIPYILIECLQKLEKLSVRGCGSLMEIFDFEGVNADGGNVVTLSHLEEVRLSNLPKLVHIFNKIPKNVIGFQKLRKLNVYDCNSLRNILSVAVAKCLVQLQELDIGRCHMLEEIIVPKEDEKEEEASNDIIVFPQLKSLTFDQLPRLKSFCNGIYALEFPLLENLKFRECNGMKTFSYGSLSMPKLKELKINYENHQLMGTPDLNSTKSQLFKEVVANDESDSSEYEVDDKSDVAKREVDDESDDAKCEVDDESDVKQL